MAKTATELFAERMRHLRKAHGWTQERAAEFCGLGYKVYQLYELGIRPNPRLATVEKIARCFGLEIHQFFAPELPKIKAQPKRKRNGAN